MDWKELNTPEDIKDLSDTFGHFHDGCIKEIKYLSGEYVAEDLAMYPFNDLRRLSVIFQRQFKDPSAVEVIFEGLHRMNLAPTYGNYDGIIMDSFLDIADGFIYWSDWEGFDVSKLGTAEYGEFTWICAKSAKWRAADEYMGNKEVYLSR